MTAQDLLDRIDTLPASMQHKLITAEGIAEFANETDDAVASWAAMEQADRLRDEVRRFIEAQAA